MMVSRQEQVLVEHLKAKKLIEESLRDDKRCRNDDMWLVLQIWRKQGANVYIKYDYFNSIFNPETIIRNRAYIQNTEHKYLPTNPKVLMRKQVKENVLRKYYAENREVIEEWEKLRQEKELKENKKGGD